MTSCGSKPGSWMVAAAVLLAPIAQAQDAEPYVFTPLKTDEFNEARAYGINVTGQTVGVAFDDDLAHSVHWLNQEFTDLHGTTHLDLLQFFNVGYTEAYEISDGDQVVGTGRKEVRCGDEIIIMSTAMILRPAVLTDLGTPFPGDALTDLGTFQQNPCFAFDSAAVGISNNNHVVGWADLDLSGTVHAFLIRPVNGVWGKLFENGIDLGTLSPLAVVSSATAVNDAGIVVGYSYTENASYHAFRVVPDGEVWARDDNGDGANDLMQDLGTLGGVNSWARGINNAGQIVGESDTVNLNTRAFLWENGVMQDLGTLGGANSSASRINDDGVIVGWAENAQGQRRAVAWINGEITDLNAALLPNADASMTFTEARDVNNSGVIVGWGRPAGTNGTLKAFHLRLATAAEIAQAEADVADQPQNVDDGDDDGTGTAGAIVTDDVTGAPLIVGNDAFNDATAGPTDPTQPDVDDGTTGGTDNDIATPPMLCGFGALSLMPLTLAGLALMRRR